MSEKRIIRRSLTDVPARIDWSRSDQLTDEDIRAAVEKDPDAAPIADADWFRKARLIKPAKKVPVTIRLDREVVEHFKRTRPRYQSAINAVLKAFVEHEKAQGR